MNKLLMMIGAAAVATSATLPARADAVRVYDVDDYVQDGLVLHFDGIRNAGASAGHVASGTAWVNLGSLGSDYNATITKTSSGTDGSWGDAGYCFSGVYEYAAVNTALDIGTNFTIQVASDINMSDQGSDAYRSIVTRQGGGNSAAFWVQNVSNNKEVRHNIKAKSNGYGNSSNDQAIQIWGGKSFTAILSADTKKLYFTQNGVLPEGESFTVVKMPGEYNIAFAGSGEKNNQLKGTFNNVRVYTKALAADQIAWNYKIDEARFRGNCDITIVNGAIGETGTNGESSFPDGCYNLGDGESWTLTAPEVRSDGHTYLPKLLVETYNASTGEWEPTTVKPQWANSYTVDKTAIGDNRIRLTWTWEIRKGLIIAVF